MLVNAYKPQIYDLQITKDKNRNATFFEIKKPEYVDLRRREIGLEGIKLFAKEKGIKWVVAQKKY